jgi:hypothetical protein
MSTINDRIKTISDKLYMRHLLVGLSHIEMYDFICEYLFGNKSFDILKYTFEEVCIKIDESLGVMYSSMLYTEDKLELYNIATEICNEKNK